MKVFVIGIDGATFNVIRPMVEAGQLPSIARALEEGCSAPLNSTVPCLSPVAWTSITTGASPALHGIIEFIAYDKAAKENVMLDATHRRTAPLWLLADRKGLRSCVVNVPLTYPVDQVNGFMLSGLGTPPTDHGMAHPVALYNEMKHAIGDYMIDVVIRKHNKKRFIADSLLKVREFRAKCFDFLLNKEQWDLFFFVFTNTDRAQHFFWRDFEKGSGPFAKVIPDSYREADAAVGKIMEKAEEEGGLLLIVSDHGFGRLKSGFSLSKWLANNGYLAARKRPVRANLIRKLARRLLSPAVIDFLIRKVFRGRWKVKAMSSSVGQWLDWDRTTVFSHKSIDTVFLYLNAEVVCSGDARSELIDELREKLLAIEDPADGTKIITAVLDGRSVFGIGNELAPDLVLMPANGYNFSFDAAELDGESEFVKPASAWFGNHEPQGVFIAWGEKIRRGVDCGSASVLDIVPTICYTMGLEIPPWAEGRILKEAFDDEFHDGRQVLRGAEESRVASTAGSALKREGSEEVAKQLKSLGYL